MNDPNGQGTLVRRRRRTRRHRRNRSIRRAVLAAAILGILLGLTASFIPDYFEPYVASHLPSRNRPGRMRDVSRDLAMSAATGTDIPPDAKGRPVYPYSLIPGGVHDPKELEAVFDHDPVLAAHYRSFDFRRARVIRLATERAVYVSYRIANHVYWTTKRVRLHAGELLITDGVMTVRTRCGNEVSENPRTEVSPNEPSMATLEKPMALPEERPAVVPIPANFESAMLRPNVPNFVAPPLTSGLIGSVGGFGPVFPPDVCGPGKKKKHPGADIEEVTKKKKGGPCEGGGGGRPTTVPEPSTILLFSTGLGTVLFGYRHRLRRS